jgi:hypothetical protein
MPNLGAGNDQHVNVSALPTWVFTPTSKLANTLRLYNEGSQPVYIGSSSVTPYNGLQILPGNKPLELSTALQAVYACCGVVSGTAVVNTTAATSAGSTVLATSAPTTNFAAGTYVSLGATTATSPGGFEVLQVSGTTATNITVSTSTLYDHASGATVTVVTPTVAQLRVTAGVV